MWKGVYPWDVRVEKICKALVKQGHQVHLLARCDYNQYPREYIDDYEVIRVGSNHKRFISTPISNNPMWRNAIKMAIEEIKPDLIIPREVMLAEVCSEFAHRKGIPVVMDMAENYPEVMRGWKQYQSKMYLRLLVHYLRYPDFVERRSVGMMDGIITVCSEQRDRLNKRFGFPYEKMQIVHNTPELSWFEGARRGSSNPPTVFAYHGFINYERNLSNLIKGFVRACKSVDNIKLVIAGKGEEYNELLNQAKSSTASEHIHFKGEYDQSDMKHLVGEMDIGILPYRINAHINNTISNKLFDYLAVGKPVIVSQSPPMIRIMEETKSGIVVDCTSEKSIAEGIISVMNMNLDAMSRNGLKAAQEKYNWEVDSQVMVGFLNRFL